MNILIEVNHEESKDSGCDRHRFIDVFIAAFSGERRGLAGA
jgi:hypothetical protein